jgi:hypothetical protein
VHIGVELMGVGLVGLYALFANVGDGLNGWGLAAPQFVYGGGMGMIFIKPSAGSCCRCVLQRLRRRQFLPMDEKVEPFD